MSSIKDAVLDQLIWVDPERMSGRACFRGTRVTVKSLFQHLQLGIPLGEFLEDFPTVQRSHADALIEWAMLQALKESAELRTIAQ